jgi:hypothetical protein
MDHHAIYFHYKKTKNLRTAAAVETANNATNTNPAPPTGEIVVVVDGEEISDFYNTKIFKSIIVLGR